MYLTLPYYFPDSDEFKLSRKQMIKIIHKHAEPSKQFEIRAFCIVFVFDSYQVIPIEIQKSILKLFVHTLVKEEVRDSYVGRQAYLALNKEQSELK